MSEATAEQLMEAMRSPFCKMVSSLIMATLTAAELDEAQTHERIQAALPKMDGLAADLGGSVGAVFTTNLLIWRLPEDAMSHFFEQEDMTLDGMMNVASDGTTQWHEAYQKGEVTADELIAFYASIKSLMDTLAGDLQAHKAGVAKLMSVQDELIATYQQGTGDTQGEPR